MAQSAGSVSTRALRENLRETLEQVSKGKEVVVTHRGKPLVRIVPILSEQGAQTRHPLRGSVLHVADDFDAPLDHAPVAPAKRPSRSSKRRK